MGIDTMNSVAKKGESLQCTAGFIGHPINVIMPEVFGVKPDSKPLEGFGGLADKLLTWFWDIIKCYGSAADPHPISRASEVHALSLDSVKSKIESGKVIGQLLIPH